MTIEIDYKITKDYLPDWTIQDALREIYQNFKDHGEYTEVMDDNPYCYPKCYEHYISVYLTNNWKSESLSFLLIGKSDKRNDPSTVGCHGEGLKMAGLVLKRENCFLNIKTTINNNPIFLKAEFKLNEDFGETKTFTLEEFDINEENPIYKYLHSTPFPFGVRIFLPKEEYLKFKGTLVKEEDVKAKTPYGDILNRPAGEIYVGGLYVTTIEDFNRSYNFKPEHVPLDRDRKVPKSFDIEWAASRILQYSDNIKPTDLSIGERETNYINDIPDKVVRKFKPSIVGGKVVFKANHIIASPIATNILSQKPIQAKRIAALKLKSYKKSNPYNILKEFYDNNNYRLGTATADFLVILEKAKKWK